MHQEVQARRSQHCRRQQRCCGRAGIEMRLRQRRLSSGRCRWTSPRLVDAGRELCVRWRDYGRGAVGVVNVAPEPVPVRVRFEAHCCRRHAGVSPHVCTETRQQPSSVGASLRWRQRGRDKGMVRVRMRWHGPDGDFVGPEWCRRYSRQSKKDDDGSNVQR